MQSTVQDTPDARAASPSMNVDPPTSPPSAAAVINADAIERRLRQQREEAAAHSSKYGAFDEDHDKRQEFRRLVEPGILRRNPKHIAVESLRVHTHALSWETIRTLK